MWSRTVLGQGAFQAQLWQPSCFLHQAFVCPAQAWPRGIASPGLSGTQPGPRHPSSSQTAVQVPALMCGAQGLAHGAETCVHCGGHDVAAPALQSTICVRPVLTYTCSPVLLPGLGCWDNQWQAHADFPPSCCPLPGLRSCCCPARSSDHSHLSLPGAAAQTFWDQSDHLSQRDQTLPCPGGGGACGSPPRSQNPSLLSGASACYSSLFLHNWEHSQFRSPTRGF